MKLNTFVKCLKKERSAGATCVLAPASFIRLENRFSKTRGKFDFENTYLMQMFLKRINQVFYFFQLA